MTETTERTIVLFDSITSSILKDELSVQEGIIRYIEFLQSVKEEHERHEKRLLDLEKLKQKVQYRGSRLKNVLEQMENFEEYQLKKEADQLQFTDMEAENKENKVPPKSESANPTETEVAVEKKKKGRQFQRPSIEHISEEDFEKLGRHDKGRLKYKQVFDTIEKFNEALSKKYELLACYKAKFKISSQSKLLAQQYFDDDKNEDLFNVSDKDMSKYGLNKLGHSKSLIINILKNNGRLQEKRRGKERFYCVLQPTITHLPVPKSKF